MFMHSLILIVEGKSTIYGLNKDYLFNNGKFYYGGIFTSDGSAPMTDYEISDNQIKTTYRGTGRSEFTYIGFKTPISKIKNVYFDIDYEGGGNSNYPPCVCLYLETSYFGTNIVGVPSLDTELPNLRNLYGKNYGKYQLQLYFGNDHKTYENVYLTIGLMDITCTINSIWIETE